jgi:Sporulation and spore germination
LKSTNLLLAAAGALVASATLLSATSGATAKPHSVKVFQGAVGERADCSKVLAVTRTISTKPTPLIAANELVKGLNAAEKKKGLSSVFSASTAGMVQQVRVVKGTAYVNFTTKASTSLNNAGTSCGRDQFFAQLEKTLGQFSEVKSVLFAIDSKPADFYSLLELVCPEELGASCSGNNF